MSHSLHRQGTDESLRDDFVVIASPGRAFEDLPARITRFRQIGSRHGMVNVPGVQSQASLRHLVFDSPEKVCRFLQELAEAKLGMSTLVSGLRHQTNECCEIAGLKPHTVNQSLGFWGRTEKLPPFPVLEISTMCGHGRVPPSLVWEMANRVERLGLDVKAAARQMGKLCLCNIFNEVRAARLLPKLVADLRAGLTVKPSSEKQNTGTRKDFGITIDETKCTQCLECLPYCPVEAIVESPEKSTVVINAQRCTECGLCCQARICPVDAIVARDLTWPRSLRGKFQHFYAPYRSIPTLAKTDQPVSYSEKVYQFSRREWPSEHTNDIEGRLRHGEAVVVVELGRPHLGTTFRDVQKVAQALLPLGLKLQQQYPPMDERSPLAEIAIGSDGSLMPEVLEERAGWVLLRVALPEEKVTEAVRCLGQTAADIDTVFALGIVSRVAQDGTTVAERVGSKTGVPPKVNCKTNVGLGYPLAQD